MARDRKPERTTLSEREIAESKERIRKLELKLAEISGMKFFDSTPTCLKYKKLEFAKQLIESKEETNSSSPKNC